MVVEKAQRGRFGNIPALERLIGPVAYRGRPSYIDRKKGKSARPTGKYLVNREQHIL